MTNPKRGERYGRLIDFVRHYDYSATPSHDEVMSSRGRRQGWWKINWDWEGGLNAILFGGGAAPDYNWKLDEIDFGDAPESANPKRGEPFYAAPYDEQTRRMAQYWEKRVRELEEERPLSRGEMQEIARRERESASQLKEDADLIERGVISPRGRITPEEKAEGMTVESRMREHHIELRDAREAANKLRHAAGLHELRAKSYEEMGQRETGEPLRQALEEAKQRAEYYAGLLRSESANPKRGEGGAPIRQVDLILSQQINKAISDEIEAIGMYGTMEGMATDPDTKAVFKNIAKEEMKHKEVLEDLAALIRQRYGM